MFVSCSTHKGLVRKRNEDYYYTDYKKGVFIVADGMGGHKSGNVASYIAVNTIVQQIENNYSKIVQSDTKNVLQFMQKWIKQTNKHIYNLSSTNSDYTGMGTTLTMAIYIDGRIALAHIGDSRAYIIKDRQIKQVTKDHSLVQELLNNGTISEQEAENHPQKNLITRALGTEPDIEVDLIDLDFNDEDVLLLCTDGLTNMLDERYIVDILYSTRNLDKFVEMLIDKSNQKGGYDNITIIAMTNNRYLAGNEVKV